ncbi:MAG: phosphonate transporter [Burkholderiales bacterium]|nr:phosphonate transporter [Burkholderiales bacterium]
MNVSDLPGFDAADALTRIAELADEDFDALDYGVIAFNGDGIVLRYSAYESAQTGLDPAEVRGLHVFTSLAQCMNNYLVAQRFEDSAAAGVPLDETIDYVLTWRMRPTKVRLRMLARPGLAQRLLLLRHRV